MLELRFHTGTKKILKNLLQSNPKITNLILLKIEQLRNNPLPEGAKKLRGYSRLYRVRLQNYRIIYEFDNERLIIIMIGVRSKVYDILDRLF